MRERVVTPSFPAWLSILASLSLLAGVLCCLVVAVDVVRHPQKMGIMNLVWPVTMLFGSVAWLWFYWRHGRPSPENEHGETPMAISVAKGASHCGAGCTIGDLIAEWLAFAVPSVAVLFGWGSLFAEKTFAVWALDYIVAFLLGIAFQYFTIKPMRDLTVRQGIVQAAKADILSITAWQVGMYGVMALAQFAWLRPSYGGIAPVDSAVFWFVMQVAMIAGFATSYPVNWWLVRSGIKERM